MLQTFLSLIIITLAFAPAVLSQSFNATESATIETNRLQEDYFFQLEKYRQAKSGYTLTRAQAAKLGTLRSQEEFVVSAKQLLLARTDVLRAYLIALKASLTNTQGIDVTDKQAALELIDQSQSRITNHKQTVSNLSSQSELANESARFELQDLPLFLESSYRSLSLISIGRLQNLADKLTVAARQFDEQTVQNLDNQTKQAEFNRGLSRISSELEAANQSTSLARTTYAQFDIQKASQKTFDSDDIYNQVTEDLSPAYSSLQQANQFLIELETSR